MNVAKKLRTPCGVKIINISSEVEKLATNVTKWPENAAHASWSPPSLVLSAGNLLTRVTWGGCAGRAIMDLNMDKTTSIYFSSYMLKTQRPAGKQAHRGCVASIIHPHCCNIGSISFLPSEYISIFHLPLLPMEDFASKTHTARYITCLSDYL